jgi:hypothetical protein
MDGRLVDDRLPPLIGQRTGCARILSWCRGLALALGILGLSWIAICSLGRETLDAEICRTVRAELSKRLAPGGLSCAIGSARFVPGRGIFLRDVRIGSSPSSESDLLSIDEFWLSSSSGWHDLLMQNVRPNGLDINRAHCVLERDALGTWNFERLLCTVLGQGDCGRMQPIPVRVRNSSVEIRLRTDDESVTYAIRDIQLHARPSQVPCAVVDSDPSIGLGNCAGMQVRGSLGGSGVDQIAVAADLDFVRRTWNASVAASSARIDSHTLRILTRSAGHEWQSNSNFRTLLDLQCTARGKLACWTIDDYQLDGKLSEWVLNDSNLPLAIRDGKAEFRLTPNNAHAWNVSAQTDQGSFQGEYRQEGPLLAPVAWRLQGNGRRLRLDQRMLPWLPATARSLAQTWSPEGVFDLKFDVRSAGGVLEPTLEADLVDVSIEYERMPYRLEHCVGRVVLKDQRCQIDLKALEGSTVFRINGSIQNPGPQYSGFVDVVTEGSVPIDGKLMRSLVYQPRSAAVIQKFRPSGAINVRARIGRDSPAQTVTQQDYRVQLLDCSVRHEDFEYPLHDVSGLVRIRNDRVDIDNVTAVHGNGNVRCDGTWTRSEGLRLQFLARTVALDDQLRAALNPVARNRWSELRPRGVVDLVQVQMTQATTDDPVRVQVDAQIFEGGEYSETSVTIHPTWFPYSLHNVVGRITIDENTIELEGIRGEHERAWIACNGSGRHDDQHWELHIQDLFGCGLDANEVLTAAFPTELAQAVQRLHWKGLVNARGRISISGSSTSGRGGSAGPGYVSTVGPRAAGQQGPVQLNWHLRVDTDAASLNAGVPMEHISGAATVRGTYDGARLQCAGEINLDSLMLAGTQINQLQGPIWLDDQQCALGTLAQNAEPDAAARSVIGAFYGGELRMDGVMQWSGDQPFYVQANVVNCDMDQLSSDLIPRHKNLNGTGFAFIRMKGDRGGRHTWRGDGKVQLRNARIEVPLMDAVGNVVRVSDLERTVFDESNLDFEIRGENLDLTQIELIGTPISMIGNGRVNHNREIDLDFYTILGRNKIHVPLVSDLYHASSQQFLHIKVDGNLDEPQTRKTVLPGINEPLRRLMDDLEGRAPARVSATADTQR